ncbi:prevent-host-death protein [Methylobacterium sp. Leaf102]|uniref:type II toxin-antitoxin system Phd/YefM family antitoxin n=1 Tax=Methylobacterium sp. Leaf102 TaxID=1736253 RepID=UPI0006FA77AD|nr:type II toxin-antitoxin system prevent-host-death family antitoxin [Methylobacterium sp. Leaf102]KQP33398.1 prevent-host-death protein [Methylobacterium sp. Leaf102]
MIVSIDDVKDRASELAERVDGGDVIVVTRNGTPVFDLVPHKKRTGGIDLAAGEAFLREHGIRRTVGFIPGDFDDPWPKDFLLRPLPLP